MYLIDTNVLSELRRAHRGHPNVLAWSRSTPSSSIFISAITVLEIERGILRLARKDAGQAAMFDRWLHHDVLKAFEGRTLAFDSAAALRCAALHVRHTMPERDSMIAATALVRDFTMVTRNVSDFAPMGLRVLDPWTDA